MALYIIEDPDVGRVFIHGELGPHCADCAAPSEYLCDYPVGDDKTCDRSICRQHGVQVGQNMHYCQSHEVMWREFLRLQRDVTVIAGMWRPKP